MLVASVVATEVIEAVTVARVDETEVLQEEHTGPHLPVDENSHRNERIETIADAIETETTTSEEDREVLSIVSETVNETEMTDEMTVTAETSVTNGTNEQMATTAKVWMKLTSKWKKYPADPYSAPESPVPAHDELDTAE